MLWVELLFSLGDCQQQLAAVTACRPCASPACLAPLLPRCMWVSLFALSLAECTQHTYCGCMQECAATTRRRSKGSSTYFKAYGYALLRRDSGVLVGAVRAGLLLQQQQACNADSSSSSDSSNKADEEPGQQQRQQWRLCLQQCFVLFGTHASKAAAVAAGVCGVSMPLPSLHTPPLLLLSCLSACCPSVAPPLCVCRCRQGVALCMRG